MTGLDLEIVDRKLDRYMARKAEKGTMSHLLIDRFRFDSFVPEADADETSRLLTRFGDLVYIYFVITPPDATVERAWKRGLRVGRYKAVDDLLYHNVEAFEGMPELFFTWALSKTKRVHCEFLDNSVAEGSRPRTAAFGWNGEMNILDIGCMINMDRYKKININAGNARDVYVDDEMPPERNVDFLKKCVALIPIVNFVDQATGRVYARIENGQWCWRDEEQIAIVLEDPDVQAGLKAIGPLGCNAASAAQRHSFKLDREKAHTLGAWGESDV